MSVTNRLTGCVESKEVFVALLGGSQYTYVEAVEDQSLTSFCEAVQNALHYFGGVPRSIVPDNLKSAVTKADRYEAEVNQNFKALALHYHTVVLPTRAYKPKDKALVEGCVRLMYQRIFYPLSSQTFFSLADLNQAIVPLLEAHNHKPFSKGGTLERGVKESRADLFQAYEKAELSPLPIQRYELRTYKEGKVAKNSHVWFGSDKHYYSVPYRYVGSNMLMVATEHSLEIYLRATHERVAVHKRNKGKVNGFTTTEAHLPPNIQFVKNWSVETFEQQATRIHVDLVPFIQKVFHTQAHPQQACTICMGILGLKKHFDTARLVKACQRAAYFDNYTYRAVKSILTQQLDQVEWRHLKDTQQENAKPLFDLPNNHPNIRGSIYYY